MEGGGVIGSAATLREGTTAIYTGAVGADESFLSTPT